MRCFTWKEGTISGGITLQDVAGEVVLHLGKHERFWNHVCVGQHPDYPPEVVEEYDESGNYPAFYVDDARILRKKYSTSSGVEFVLAEPPKKTRHDDGSVLVVVSTAAGNLTVDKGFWRTLAGQAQTLAKGVKGTEPEQHWLEGLIRLSPGDALHISVTDPKVEDYVLSNYDGVLHTETWTQYFED